MYTTRTYPAHSFDTSEAALVALSSLFYTAHLKKEQKQKNCQTSLAAPYRPLCSTARRRQSPRSPMGGRGAMARIRIYRPMCLACQSPHTPELSPAPAGLAVVGLCTQPPEPPRQLLELPPLLSPVEYSSPAPPLASAKVQHSAAYTFAN